MPRYLNAGCGTHYAAGWVNVDVWQDQDTNPDIIANRGEPYPFDDNTFDAVYLGHVLEHVEWGDVRSFLLDMNRVAKPGAPILAVGPDVYRTILRWKDGKEPWSMLESVLEHQNVYGGYKALSGETVTESWVGLGHHWNCHESRMFDVMQSVLADCRLMTDAITYDTRAKTWHDQESGITWPVVGYWHWQCAVMGYAQ